MGTILFKDSIKFRKECNYILLCDCMNVVDYELPLEYFSLLVKLQNGHEETLLTDAEKDVIDDFKALSFFVDVTEDDTDMRSLVWDKVRYDEREFFI